LQLYLNRENWSVFNGHMHPNKTQRFKFRFRFSIFWVFGVWVWIFCKSLANFE
jgi:hypothetical protein